MILRRFCSRCGKWAEFYSGHKWCRKCTALYIKGKLEEAPKKPRLYVPPTPPNPVAPEPAFNSPPVPKKY